MIVKVQQSITTNEDYRQVLIYNKDKSLFYQCDLTDELSEFLGDDLKAFYIAKLNKQREIELIKRTKNYNW